MQGPNLFIAHVTDERTQTVKEHCENVSNLCFKFGKAFFDGNKAKKIGLLHDIGKYSTQFQKRIRGDTIKVDHSTAGAWELFKKKDIIGAICIASHHSGLLNLGSNASTPEDGTFLGRMLKAKNNAIPDYSLFKEEIQLSNNSNQPTIPNSNIMWADDYFRTKFLFSCLVDADFLDTEKFVKNEAREFKFNSINELLEMFNSFVSRFSNPNSELNRIRNMVRNECIKKGKTENNFFSLSVPTGGGKTLSSLAFALNHAYKNGKDRIIYVIPYTSIIDQTVQVFENIFGKNNVLPHYSEYEFDEEDENEYIKKLATENWDFPIVVTTSVQFFESIFSHKTSKSRKLHNIANSVIVFDEYQTIPLDNLKICTIAIEQLISHFNATVLLCTATQPGTQRFYNKTCEEIIPNPTELFKQLQRTTYRDIGEIDILDLSRKLSECPCVLCIVNTRKVAQRLYDAMDCESKYHLSTMMVPSDRQKTLAIIRSRLKNGQPCKVISTSLIEAGVDLDFPEVYREENGLDSILQAGGRCNREGKMSKENSIVNVFSLKDITIPFQQRKNRDAMVETILSGYDYSMFDAVQVFFNNLYDLKGDEALDKKHIVRLINEGNEEGHLPFKTIGESFKMIDSDTKTLYIPSDSISLDLKHRIIEGERSRQLFRELGRYSIQVYTNIYDQLFALGHIEVIDETISFLKDMSLYSNNLGLMIPNYESGTAIFI